MIQTVNGLVTVPDDGVILVHEHLYFDMSLVLDDVSKVLRDVPMTSGALRAAALSPPGLRLVVDAATFEMGRNPWALREISNNTGVGVVASTGRFREVSMPSNFEDILIDDLVDMYVRDLTVGIEGSSVIAGNIGEIGTDGECFTNSERVNFVAAAVAQAETGASIITHTPHGKFGVEQAELLIKQGADPSRICIGHLDCIPDIDYYGRIRDLGVYLGLDKIGSGRTVPDSMRAKVVAELIERGWHDRLLISNDVATAPRVTSTRSYDYCFGAFWKIVQRISDAADDVAFDAIFRANPGRLLSWKSV